MRRDGRRTDLNAHKPLDIAITQMNQTWSADDLKWMRLALEEAARGQGFVEPNPMVGCVVVKNGVLISSGFHRKYGTAHAEVDAISSLSDGALEGAAVYVTLEPCSHYGKTPPCANFLLERRPKRVVIAMRDPFPEVSGRGVALLEKAGIHVEVGLLESESKQLNAPYLKLLSAGRPWVIAKWAMTLDGAIATSSGDSKWISNEKSRSVVHEIRSRVDAIVTGIGTVLADDPMLNARVGSGKVIPRIATRVVLDRGLRTPLDSNLVKTAKDIPLVIVTNSSAADQQTEDFRSRGVEIWQTTSEQELEFGSGATIQLALMRLGQQRATNVLLESGAQILGTAVDFDLVDQIECFIAPKIVGGNAMRPILGQGVGLMRDASKWNLDEATSLDQDIWLRYRK